MKTEQHSRVYSKYVNWAEVVVHLTDIKFLNKEKLNQLSSIFRKVHVLAPETEPSINSSDISWQVYGKTKTRTELWNAQLQTSECDWVLFLEDDEEIIFLDFPDEDKISNSLWAPALITVKTAEKEKQFYQMRLVYNGGTAVFQGQDYPDCTNYIIQNDTQITNMPIQIERNSSFVEHVDTTKELSTSDFAPSVYLVEGQRCFQNGKYAQAASAYRQLLKRERLLPFDRLAAVNGLASCYTEQFKWEKALILTEKSLEAESLQNLPYLIEFKIHQLQQNWDKAFQALNRYHESVELHSKANFDVILSEEETLINLVDLSMKLGERNKAKEYLNEIFQLRNGEVDQAFLKKLLLLCIELKDKKRSIFFFKKAFGDVSTVELCPEKKTEFNDYMSMFMKNGWYEFVHQVYKTLLIAHPDEDEYKRRLIVVSVKTNRIEEARKLATKVA